MSKSRTLANKQSRILKETRAQQRKARRRADRPHHANPAPVMSAEQYAYFVRQQQKVARAKRTARRMAEVRARKDGAAGMYSIETRAHLV